MECKRVAVLMVIMLTVGNLMVESEAISFRHFLECYKTCVDMCFAFVRIKIDCPVRCVGWCKEPPPITKPNEIDQIDYSCEVDCITRRCVSVKYQNTEVDVKKAMVCVNSCSDLCNKKN
ncbi:hypothetical protein EUTSA_v10019821mg [Eutrema salsugineum]|uniref:Thionin-like protein n=1 Tax=Eutrema salsugineum TaxID=72664 RepID=V4KAW6_EUTSA|nr:hypothetical protein EUTSA_v10019821mg [Eutrema salsugineum]